MLTRVHVRPYFDWSIVMPCCQGCFSALKFLVSRALVNPVVGSFQIFPTSIEIVAFHISPLAVHQVHVDQLQQAPR